MPPFYETMLYGTDSDRRRPYLLGAGQHYHQFAKEGTSSMLSTGQIVMVEVRTVATFGLFCRWEEQEVLVLIPETSWVASYCSCHQFAAPGDRLRVKVIHVDAASGKVSASITALHPDPWPCGLLALRTEHQAR